MKTKKTAHLIVLTLSCAFLVFLGWYGPYIWIAIAYRPLGRAPIFEKRWPGLPGPEHKMFLPCKPCLFDDHRSCESSTVRGLHCTCARQGHSPTPPKRPGEARAALEERWEGIWFWPQRGDLFRAELQLAVDREDTVTGQIRWTYLATSQPGYRGDVGHSGVEFVSGSLDSSRDLLDLEGTGKDDPWDFLGLDRYRLQLSPDRKALRGVSESWGSWEAVFSLHRPPG